MAGVQAGTNVSTQVRILIIVDCYLPNTKSSAKLIHDLALEFRHADHQVTVLAPDDSITQPFAVTLEHGLQIARVRTGRIKGASWITAVSAKRFYLTSYGAGAATS